ncbi:MAG: DUF4129 domain-containing protein [Minicystis sp.]
MVPIALAALAFSPAVRAEEGGARAVLKSERYRFCHEKDYPLTPEEHDWCPTIGESSESCPALPEACKLPPVEGRDAAELRSLRGGRGARQPGKAGDGSKGEDDASKKRPLLQDDRRRPEPEANLRLPDLSGFAQILLVVMIAAFAVAIARALARNFSETRAADPATDKPPADEPSATEAAAARGPIETDVERLLARARAAAARGDFARAIDDAYAALLRRLDGDGLIDIHPSRTNGDYVRALADRPDLRRAVRDVVRDVERVQFGSSAPSEQIFRAVFDRVVPLVGRALGVVLLCLGLGSAVSCKQLEDAAGGGTPGGTSPSGMQAIADLLAQQKIDVHFRSEPFEKLEGPTTLVLVPGVQVDDEGWKKLLTWVRDRGGRLVLAGVAPPQELGIKIDTGGGDDRKVRVAWTGYGALTLSIPPGHQVVPRGSDDDEQDDAMLLRAQSVYALHRVDHGGTITVLADDRLFTNAAVAVPENALFLARFFGSLPEPHEVEICDAWTGVGASTPFESVQHAHLTPLVLQLFVLLLLLFLWRGRAFSRLRDPPAETRRAFADHARALGLAYGRARASRHVLGLYAVWALERLRERVHRSGRQGLLPLAEGIAARTGKSEAEVMRVLVDATSARDEAAPPSSFRPRGASFGAAAKPARDEVATDLALMSELEGFLTATGARRPARRSRNQPS